jgi:pantetheine-phosphate adenylyltransferase
LIKESLSDVKNVRVDTFNGLVVDFVRSTESIAIIRGLRHVSDFEFEFQMAMMNFNLNPNIKSLFMMPDEKYIHLNSTVIKDVARLGGDISDYVPKCVQDALYKQYNV